MSLHDFRLVIIDGLFKMGSVCFFVPTIMFFIVDVSICFDRVKADDLASCRFGYMDGIREDLITYIGISLLAGLTVGFIFLVREKRRHSDKIK